jgi:hypothetical protein
MKRFIVIECNDELSTMFVAIHEGEGVCMTPLVISGLADQCRAAVKAVPVDNIVDCPMHKEDLLAVLDRYLFHCDWPGNRDWHGNRVHELRSDAEMAARKGKA